MMPVLDLESALSCLRFFTVFDVFFLLSDRLSDSSSGKLRAGVNLGLFSCGSSTSSVIGLAWIKSLVVEDYCSI